MLDYETIVRTCREVHRMSRMANWQWKGMPVLQWEFATIGDFARAKVDILQAIQPHMVGNTEAAWQRVDGPEICELDCHGITFRLICKQRLAAPGGKTYGAAQVVISGPLPSFRDDA